MRHHIFPLMRIRILPLVDEAFKPNIACEFVLPNVDRKRRERLKPALYPRLKKRNVFKIVKGGPFGYFQHPFSCKISKK